MHSFHYHNGQLACESVDLAALAANTARPLRLQRWDHPRSFSPADGRRSPKSTRLVCYAVKANSNLAVLDLLARERAGFDIVLGGRGSSA